MSISNFDGAFEAARKKSLENARPTDKIDTEGFRYCPICGERKEMVIPGFLSGRKLGISCACVRAKNSKREEDMRKNHLENQIEEIRRRGISDAKYASYTFKNDKGYNSSAMDYCRFYVEKWLEKKESGEGVLFYGSPGTGKSFAAGCIVNAIIERYIEPAFVTNFPRILNMNYDAREYAIDKIANSPLVVFDDLGVERKYDSALETIYYAIDTRALSGKPTIFTTNLELSVIENEQNTNYRRIYDRVLGMCPVKLCVVGESHRRENAVEMAAKEREEFAKWQRERKQNDKKSD